MTKLPTPEEMFGNAEAAVSRASAALDDARAWLLSDWRDGTSLTDEQAARRTRMLAGIRAAKNDINEAKG